VSGNALRPAAMKSMMAPPDIVRRDEEARTKFLWQPVNIDLRFRDVEYQVRNLIIA